MPNVKGGKTQKKPVENCKETTKCTPIIIRKCLKFLRDKNWLICIGKGRITYSTVSVNKNISGGRKDQILWLSCQNSMSYASKHLETTFCISVTFLKYFKNFKERKFCLFLLKSSLTSSAQNFNLKPSDEQKHVYHINPYMWGEFWIILFAVCRKLRLICLGCDNSLEKCWEIFE